MSDPANPWRLSSQNYCRDSSERDKRYVAPSPAAEGARILRAVSRPLRRDRRGRWPGERSPTVRRIHGSTHAAAAGPVTGEEPADTTRSSVASPGGRGAAKLLAQARSELPM